MHNSIEKRARLYHIHGTARQHDVPTQLHSVKGSRW